MGPPCCPGCAGVYGDEAAASVVVVAGAWAGAVWVDVVGAAVWGVIASAFAALMGLCVYTGMPDMVLIFARLSLLLFGFRRR